MVLIFKALLRAHLKHPALVLMTFFGVLFGVTSVVSIELVNQSVRDNFIQAKKQLYGGASHKIVAQTPYFHQQLYTRLVKTFPEIGKTPVLHAYLPLEQGSQRLQLIALDPFTQTGSKASVPAIDPLDLLRHHNGIFLSENLAKRLNLKRGDSLVLPGKGQMLYIAATLSNIQDLAIMDLSWAQPLLGKKAQLSFIRIQASPQQARLLSDWLPKGFALQTISRELNADEIGDALQFNLSALGLLALVVGLFLVYNSVRFNQLHRQTMFNRFILLGVSPPALLLLLILELLLLVGLAAIGGLLLGQFLATKLMLLVTQTVNDLYGPSPIADLSTSSWIYLNVFIITLLGSMAACIPSWKALCFSHQTSAAKPATFKPRLVWFSLIGLSTLVVINTYLPTGLIGGFIAIASLLMACSLLAVLLTYWLSKLFATHSQHTLIRHFVFRELSRNLKQTSVNQVALLIAIAAAVGIAIMVFSFRISLDQWLVHRLNADIYLSMQKTAGSARPELPEEVFTYLQKHRSVKEVNRRALTSTRLNSKPIEWLGMDIGSQLKQAYPLLKGKFPQARSQVLVSEPLIQHFGLAVGDTITPDMFDRQIKLEISGVYRDYSNDKGQILQPYSQFRQLWPETPLRSLAIYIQSEEHEQRLKQHLTQKWPYLNLLSGRSIFSQVSRIFERTFTITELLRWLSLGIAFIGICCGLCALMLGKQREFYLMAKLGFLPVQIRQIICWQSIFLGLITGLMAIPAGLGTAYLLTHTINPRAFGWSLTYQVEFYPLLEGLLMAVMASLLAALLTLAYLRRSGL